MAWYKGKYVLDHPGYAVGTAKPPRKTIAEAAGEAVANPKKAMQGAQDALGKPIRKFAEGYYREKAKK